MQRYGNDDGVSGGGSSSSRKSQINPFVIPHRSFQPVRIFTTSLLCHLRTLLKLFPLFSSVSLLSCQERFYNSTVSICLVLPAYPGLTLPYFRHSFLLSFPHGPSVPRSLAPLLARLLVFLFRLSPVRIFPSRNFARVSASVLIRTRVSARHAPITFVSFAFPARPSIERERERDLLAIHAYHHYDIWRRKLQLEWGPPGFETTFVTVGSANRNWSSCCGERDKEIY